MKWRFTFILLGSLACTMVWLADSAMGQQQDSDAESQEIWGGDHVSMRGNAHGATLEFDCASGSMAQPIKPDAKGDFSVAGTYTPERGGPVMKANPSKDLPAVYKGSIEGNTMHLEIVLTDKDREPPAFSLTRGARGRVVKCR